MQRATPRWTRRAAAAAVAGAACMGLSACHNERPCSDYNGADSPESAVRHLLQAVQRGDAHAACNVSQTDQRPAALLPQLADDLHDDLAGANVNNLQLASTAHPDGTTLVTVQGLTGGRSRTLEVSRTQRPRGGDRYQVVWRGR